MGREVYFFKFDRQLAKDSLANILQEKSDNSYKNFLKDSTSWEVDFDEVFQKVNNDIEELGLDELWTLYNWFYYKIDLQYEKASYAKINREFNKEMKRNGLELFYEIPSKTPAGYFFSLLSDYRSLMNTGFYYIFQSDYFNNFLDYSIAFTGFISQLLIEDYYGKDDGFHLEQFWVIEGKLYQILENNLSQYELALEEFDRKKERYIATIKKIKKFKNTSKKMMNPAIYNEYSDVKYYEEELFGFDYQFSTISDMKKALGGYKGTIKVLDSY